MFPSPAASARLRDAAFAVTGPAVVGAVVGLSAPLDAALASMWRLPLAVCGSAVLLLPGLYIASAYIDEAPAPQVFFEQGLGALGDVGAVALGFAPALAFLLAAGARRAGAGVLTHALFMACGLMWTASLARRVGLLDRAGRSAGHAALFVMWSLVAAGVAWRLVSSAVGGVQ